LISPSKSWPSWRAASVRRWCLFVMLLFPRSSWTSESSPNTR